MSMESQLLTHYNEGTTGSYHSNLDPMKIIMQELQLMRKDMKEMRGNITNLCMKQEIREKLEGISLLKLNRDMGNRLGARNSYNNTCCKRVLRNEVKNRGNYVKMEKRFHKRKRGDVERYHDSYDHYKHSYGSKDCILSTMIFITMEGIIEEEGLKLWELHQDLLVTTI
ncbi:hypothetical protein M9H77_36208 [Catharanthus roseus]|uniref:Uncharacterized protein n=1 Tax=Catharanthus roseus TaxID=4058 RepID=A0ACB9ZRZ3_CATRO|nr:hypothetical protein M9H77_36208 [Catharanthus roseus]